MFKFSLSVRAYNNARRYGLPCLDEWAALSNEALQKACRKAADSVLAHGRGTRTAIELYRAAGLGVYNIGLIMGGDIERIRTICTQIDERLHESLN